jgi:phosphohistidine phosphatase
MQGDTFTLILVRHGEAASTGGTVHSDEERPLTAKGIEDVTALGKFLAAIEPNPSIIISSPLLRAVQTARAIAGAYPADTLPLSVSNVLRSGTRPRDLWSELLTLRRAGQTSIIAVGHQPDIGDAVSNYVAGSAVSVSIMPGTALRLVGKASGGRAEAILHWIVTPAMARAATGMKS